ncbi:arginine deiminase, partial [bacterium]
MAGKFPIAVDSETGRLTGVVMHEPGSEIANMTPENAERALYSDILNLAVAADEYAQLKGVLEKRTRIFGVKDLLADILLNPQVRSELVARICAAEDMPAIADMLADCEPRELSRLLIEGVPLVKDNLSRFLSRDRYSLPPLHNFFFSRDAAAVVGDRVLVSRMANQVRGREACIMEAIFDYHPDLGATTVNPALLGGSGPTAPLEGGDVLVAAPDILLMGLGARTSR